MITEHQMNMMMIFRPQQARMSLHVNSEIILNRSRRCHFESNSLNASIVFWAGQRVFCPAATEEKTPMKFFAMTLCVVCLLTACQHDSSPSNPTPEPTANATTVIKDGVSYLLQTDKPLCVVCLLTACHDDSSPSEEIAQKLRAAFDRLSANGLPGKQ